MGMLQSNEKMNMKHLGALPFLLVCNCFFIVTFVIFSWGNTDRSYMAIGVYVLFQSALIIEASTRHCMVCKGLLKNSLLGLILAFLLNLYAVIAYWGIDTIGNKVGPIVYLFLALLINYILIQLLFSVFGHFNSKRPTRHP